MSTEAWTPDGTPPESLEWGSLRLDRWRTDDRDDLYAAVQASRPELETFMVWARNYELSGAEWFLNDAVQAWENRTAFNYRASLPGDARVLAGVGLMARQGPGVLEIGYWVHGDARRRGVAWRASAALTSAGLALPGVDRIEIHHDPRNTASAGIPAKLGYTRLPDLVAGPPGREDEAMVAWVVRQDEWVPVRG